MSVRVLRLVVLLLASLIAGPASALDPVPLPEGVRTLLPAGTPGLERVGQARLRRYLLHIYDATLWAPGGRYDVAGTVVLDIRYARAIRAEQITAQTLVEWQRMGLLDGEAGARLRAALTDPWPDVAAGDHLTAVAVPGAPLRILHNGRPYAEFADPAFAPAFLSIWLGEQTSEPMMRRRLLGETE